MSDTVPASSMAWISIVHDDQQALRAQADELQATLAVSADAASRRSAMAWVLDQLTPALAAHLQQHEDVLFPIVERLVGRQAGALQLMRDEHRELRTTLARLQAPMEEDAVPLLVALLNDHQAKTERLIVDVLRHTLTSGAQDALAEALAAHGAPDQRPETSVSVPLVRAVA